MNELRINVSQKEFSAKQGREDACNYDLAWNIINAIQQTSSGSLYPEKRSFLTGSAEARGKCQLPAS